MLRGLPPEETKKSLEAVLTEFGKRGIKVVLLGMLAAPNYGKDYAGAFNAIYPALAKKHGAALVPFFMQPLIEKPELVQPDRVHPTAQGVEAMVASTVEVVAGAVERREDNLSRRRDGAKARRCRRDPSPGLDPGRRGFAQLKR